MKDKNFNSFHLSVFIFFLVILLFFFSLKFGALGSFFAALGGAFSGTYISYLLKGIKEKENKKIMKSNKHIK